ncbi:MAG TPA: MmgE/PrpD family protein [Xanthobacteraceae bacterium]|nr:MmgE/PrpD family protein [Xanthobacteraceae bacterium]
MTHAEAVHTLQPAAGATSALTDFVAGLSYESLHAEVQHYARRHFLDTLGVMIAGAAGDIATRAETTLAAVRVGGRIPVPGRARRADLLDAAFLGGTAAHGIELDDGYRQGSVHPGCAVVPAVLAVGYDVGASGKAVVEAMVAGYETAIAIARACHPDLRQRGFHPTGACAVFGAAAAAAKLRDLPAPRIVDALGIAASSAAGLFAFVNGGADVKRLHAGHASREGLQAALLAEQGVQGPPGAIEARDGFMQAFAFGRSEKVRPVALPPAVPFGITDCYIKPYACCRHLQPAVEALMELCRDEKISPDEVTRIEVDTYRIAAEHAHTGWDDFASAQLSFPYLIGLALRFGTIRLEHFGEDVRLDPALREIARKLHVTATPEVDRLYPQLRPARVKVTTARGVFTRHADEALGSRLVPLDDAGLQAKFDELVSPVLGPARAASLGALLWNIEACPNVCMAVEAAAKPAD